MLVLNTLFLQRLQGFMLFLVVSAFFVAGPVANAAEAGAKKQVKETVSKSMKALWTGQAFSADLKKKQKILKNKLETGAVHKVALKDMIKKTVSELMDNRETSRYILKDMPERTNRLFSPYLDWKTVKQIIWKVMVSVVDEDRQVQIKIGTLAPPGTPWLSVPRKLAIPRIKKLSGGKVIIKIYGGGVMGADTDILRKMDIGQLDGCGATALGVLKASPDASVFLLPGLFNNYEEVDYIFKKFRKRIDRAFAKRGYILAALIDTGWFHIFSKNKIADLDDVRQQKMLTWFGSVEVALYDELGINATPVAVPEVVSALSTGMANTNLAPAAWMLGMQAYQYANYYLKPALLYSPAAVIVSKNTKDRLQKEMAVSDIYAYNTQELLVYEFNMLEDEWRSRIRNYERKSLQAFQEKCGMKAMTLPAEDQKKLEKAAREVRERLAGKAYPEDLLNDVLKALKKYRSNH